MAIQLTPIAKAVQQAEEVVNTYKNTKVAEMAALIETAAKNIFSPHRHYKTGCAMVKQEDAQRDYQVLWQTCRDMGIEDEVYEYRSAVQTLQSIFAKQPFSKYHNFYSI
ncbi:MAG TPA: hypothetical protein VLG44_01300 [Chlamydiales bacterium]|nr:hypothetical protein [Chlamydiales bacterium]